MVDHYRQGHLVQHLSSLLILNVFSLGDCFALQAICSAYLVNLLTGISVTFFLALSKLVRGRRKVKFS